MDSGDVSVLTVISTAVGGFASLFALVLSFVFSSMRSLVKDLGGRVQKIENAQVECYSKVRDHAAKHLHDLLTPVAEQLKRVQAAVDSLSTVLAERSGSGAENQRAVEFRLGQLEEELRRLQSQYVDIKTQVTYVQAKTNGKPA